MAHFRYFRMALYDAYSYRCCSHENGMSESCGRGGRNVNGKRWGDYTLIISNANAPLALEMKRVEVGPYCGTCSLMLVVVVVIIVVDLVVR